MPIGAMTAEETHLMPRTLAEGRRALTMRARKGERRSVAWHHIETRKPAQHYPINVSPGNELTVRVYSGIPFLEVESGHVTVVFGSTWGNSLNIHPGATAHVVVPSGGIKVTISGDTSGLTLDVPEGDNRVRVYGH